MLILSKCSLAQMFSDGTDGAKVDKFFQRVSNLSEIYFATHDNVYCNLRNSRLAKLSFSNCCF